MYNLYRITYAKNLETGELWNITYLQKIIKHKGIN
jgi:hypothetical protein